MKATVVVDNIGTDTIHGEWGLCIYIEYEGKKILLDAGASGAFADNAKELGVNISDVDYGILSHAHYDHANGMIRFFDNNNKEKFYVRSGCGENCYKKVVFFKKYIGIPRHILKDYSDRIIKADGDYVIDDGITLVPHKTEGLDKVGLNENMFVRVNRKYVPDSFEHEQSLVFDTQEGLVIFNSCSHGGADVIIKEVADTFPDKKVLALIGGFHLFNKSESYVREFAKRVRDTGIKHVYTGHCTGNHSYGILKEELGDIVEQLKIGLVMEF